MANELDFQFSRPSGVLIREIDGELLLLNSESDQYYSLNSIGAQMYSMATSDQPIDQVVQGLADLWQVDSDTIRADLSELLGELAAKGLILREPLA